MTLTDSEKRHMQRMENSIAMTEPTQAQMSRVMRVEIPERNFYLLPEKTRELIHAYGISVGTLGRRNAPLAFEIAEYRWREIQESIKP
jgi:hypothetical protein